MLRLAEKAFAPAPIPFPVMHVDTGPQLPRGARRSATAGSPSSGVQLIVASVPEAIDAGPGRASRPTASRNRIQTPVLLDAVEKYRFDALFGGARRDEEKARAKERVFSFRDEFGQWDPQEPAPRAVVALQRPDPPGRVDPGVPAVQLDRAGRLALHRRGSGIELPSIYFAHEREVVDRDGMLYAVNEFICRCATARQPFTGQVRYRTVGDASLHGGGRSPTRPPSRRSSRRSPRPGSPSAAPPAATTGSARPPWKTASGRATSDDRRRRCRIRAAARWTCCGSPPPAASTTASRR